MREVFLVNKSASTLNLPLFKKDSMVNRRGVTIKVTKFIKLSPGQEFVLGEFLSNEERNFYRQFASVDVYLRVREIPEHKEEVETGVENNSRLSITSEELLSMKVSELLPIAQDLHIEKADKMPKAILISQILERL